MAKNSTKNPTKNTTDESAAHSADSNVKASSSRARNVTNQIGNKLGVDLKNLDPQNAIKMGKSFAKNLTQNLPSTLPSGKALRDQVQESIKTSSELLKNELDRFLLNLSHPKALRVIERVTSTIREPLQIEANQKFPFGIAKSILARADRIRSEIKEEFKASEDSKKVPNESVAASNASVETSSAAEKGEKKSTAKPSAKKASKRSATSTQPEV